MQWDGPLGVPVASLGARLAVWVNCYSTGVADAPMAVVGTWEGSVGSHTVLSLAALDLAQDI